jgi:predicted transposase/invertase (TIGR01784 family)
MTQGGIVMLTQYLDPTTDIGFKKLFGEEASRPVLKGFLSDLLELPSPMGELTFIPNEQEPRSSEERLAISSISCQVEHAPNGDVSGGHFSLEMYRTHLPYLKDRAFYYSMLAINQQGRRRDWDGRLKPVYWITLLNFPFHDDGRYLSRLQLMDDHNNVFSDKLVFIYVDLPAFNLTLDRLRTPRERWMYLLKHASEFQEVPEIFSEEPFKLAFHLIELARLTEEERYYYEKNLKLDQ